MEVGHWEEKIDHPKTLYFVKFPTCRVSSCLRGIEPTLFHARAPYSAQTLPLDYAPEDTFQYSGKTQEESITYGPIASLGRSLDSKNCPSCSSMLHLANGALCPLSKQHYGVCRSAGVDTRIFPSSVVADRGFTRAKCWRDPPPAREGNNRYKS
ncbi:hypothetical protein RND71_031279 [Anisodus tanguticus]|uniref:Uncharacterized protein n=1 Tax=Anisodus tanguticus TaxID=243964 RepID=A0AAE1RAA7_9SOLA|nr:hypothetical protein RND71_031279 [Anisodus tanguticus]